MKRFLRWFLNTIIAIGDQIALIADRYEEDRVRDGDHSFRQCASCHRHGLRHVAVVDPYASEWILWNAAGEHHAACGLLCANGMDTKSRLAEMKKAKEIRKIHTAGWCPICTPQDMWARKTAGDA